MQVDSQTSAVRSSDREIRLLDLLPGTGDDAIRCTTRVVSLDSHPDYETVSYVWGDRTEERDIDVSGNYILVTKNLYAGLRRLRHAGIKRTLWIDQICINQWDLEEKAAQVALMRDIYRQCTQCVTWMGELTKDGCEVPLGDAEAVFDFLRRVAAAKTTPMGDLPVLFEKSGRGSAARRAFEAFSMYGNTWWSRIWTVQEAIIPSSGILIWGPLVISREDVLAAARNLRDLSNLPSLPEGFAHYRHTYTALLRRLLYPVHGFNHSKTDNALNLLMRWRHREFTDPRDKVYALLGIIEPNAIPNAQSCDYTIPVSRLFSQVTLDLINHEGSLRPLLGACEMPQQSPDIPSWAIDFACVNRIGKRQLRWWGHSHRYRVFSACGEQSLELSETPDIHVLGLNGIKVDKVVHTVELLRVSAQDSIDLLELCEPLKNCVQLLERFRASEEVPGVYKDGFTWESAFCRTLVGDLIMDEIPLDRIARYGRAKLEADFHELFDRLHITLRSGLSLDLPADFAPHSPVYQRNSPVYQRNSPVYQPTSPVYQPTSPVYQPTLPAYQPTSPAYQPTSPTLEPNSPSPHTPPIPPTYSPPPPTQSTIRRISNASSTSTTSAYSEPRWITLPTEQTPYLSPANDERRLSGIRRPRGEPPATETPPPSILHTPESGAFTNLRESLVGMMENQTFFVTEAGYIGIGPAQTRAGDGVWVFRGGSVPFVMRGLGRGEAGCAQLALVGDAYVHGIMDGEAVCGSAIVEAVRVL